MVKTKASKQTNYLTSKYKTITKAFYMLSSPIKIGIQGSSLVTKSYYYASLITSSYVVNSEVFKSFHLLLQEDGFRIGSHNINH
jgi:hypothetical protein